MLMDSPRLIFDSSSSSLLHTCQGNMFFFGGGNQVTFRGEGGRSMLSMDEACLTAGASAGKRRSFFTTTEHLMMMDNDDYYYDEQPEKKRRLTAEQVQMLERSFEEENKLEPERKSELAKKLGLQPRQVAVWFQNRRARWKTKQLERDFDLLKSSYDSLLAIHESLLKDNLSLRSQIFSLTEKFQAKNSSAAGSTTIGGGPSAGDRLVGQPGTAVSSNTGNGVAAAAIFVPSKIDHLSTGGSTEVGQESPQLVDSADSDLPHDVGRGCGFCALEVGGVQSEEEDGSDIDGRGFFFGVFEDAAEITAAEITAAVVGHGNQQPEEEVRNALGWWVWS